jgi:hypothetical protein
VKVFEIRALDSLTSRRRRLLDDLLGRHPNIHQHDLAVYVIEGIPGTGLQRRLLIAPARSDLKPGSVVKCHGIYAAAGEFVVGSDEVEDESLETCRDDQARLGALGTA